MAHLIYDLQTANENGEFRHAQDVMTELGIEYQHATPQSISSEWWFWNCENIPEKLPPYLKIADLKLDLKQKLNILLNLRIIKEIRFIIKLALKLGYNLIKISIENLKTLRLNF